MARGDRGPRGRIIISTGGLFDSKESSDLDTWHIDDADKISVNADDLGITDPAPTHTINMANIDLSIAVTICPSCYGERDLKIPLLFLPTNRRFVLPNGEVIARENWPTAICPACGRMEH